MTCILPHTEPSGRFDLHCLQCCVRLVESTRPRKDLAALMLEAIQRNGGPERSEILKSINRKKGVQNGIF